MRYAMAICNALEDITFLYIYINIIIIYFTYSMISSLYNFCFFLLFVVYELYVVSVELKNEEEIVSQILIIYFN